MFKPRLEMLPKNQRQYFPKFIVREQDRHTLHTDVQGIKLSFIGNYRYPLMEKPVLLDKSLGREWKTILSEAVKKSMH